MKLHPVLQHFLDTGIEKAFVTNKDGTTYFFPWNSRKPGYILTNPEIREKFIRFYSRAFTLFIIAITICGICTSVSENFLFLLIGWPLCTAILLLVYQRYINQIVHALPITKYKYNDLVLDAMIPDEEYANEEDPQ